VNSLQLWQYLQLVRLPNIFTVPSNVLVGYLAVHDGLTFQLAGLVSSSILLYVSGIVFNDYSDFEHDRKNRPNRPLASGKVSRRSAAKLAVGAIVAGNVLALLAGGPAALTVTLVLSAVIIAYDFRLKSRVVAGTISMSFARFLNVVLGASPALLILLSDGSWNQDGLLTVIAAAASLFFYIAGIMVLSRREEEQASGNHRILVAAMTIAIAASIGVFGYSIGWDYWYLAMLAVFVLIIAITFWKYDSISPEFTQKTIRNMILSIIVLDSIFLTGTAGIQYGAAVLLLTIPAFVLGKRMYVT
jgi:4-hydroxybenzoate polyprenyltransferase